MTLSTKYSRRWNTLFLILFIFTCNGLIISQSLTPDSSTLLLLQFNNSLNGANGESPLTSQNLTYSNSGLYNQALNATHPQAQLVFPSTKLNIQEGSLEFWFKPTWNGNDNQTHFFFHYNPDNGFGLLKDGGNNLIFYANAIDKSGVSWKINVYNVNHWVANKWYHLTVTWKNNEIRTYVNGQIAAETKSEFKLSNKPYPSFNLFSEDPGVSSCLCLVDELRISRTVRSSIEVTSTYLKALNLVGPSSVLKVLNPKPIELFETWNVYLKKPGFWNVPKVFITNGTDTAFVSNEAIVWTVSDTNHAQIVNGVLVAKKVGSLLLLGNYLNWTVSIPIVVKKAIKAPLYESKIDPFLTTPATCAHDIMPVLIISYVPTLDGVNLDLKEIKDELPIPQQTVDYAKAHILGISKHTKYTLEEGSKFRGYDNPNALPYLGYKVLDYITVYEGVPRGFPEPGTKSFFTDFNQIISRFNGKHYVEDLGVKEIWIFGIHSDEVIVVESNMSSPTTGDISNSYRANDDQPIYNKTYITYNYNITRTGNEAVHNHGHQLEAMCSYVAEKQDGNGDFFWKEFVGWGSALFPKLRGGDTHQPPNTLVDYDYYNSDLVLSDFLDWKPGGGKATLVNKDTWGNVPYNWPPAKLPESYNAPTMPNVESNWYLMWMQGFPGYGNKIPYGSRYLSNWWRFVADWDKNYNIGLHQANVEENAKCSIQPTPAVFDIDDDICDAKGKTVKVPVRVTNFKNIRSFTMTVQVEDKSIGAITNISSTLNGFDKFESEVGKTYTIRYNNSTPLTLTDGSIAFTIEVLLNGNLNQNTKLNLISVPLSIAAAKLENGTTSSIPVEVKSGGVCIKNTLAQISGQLKTRKNEGIFNATVSLHGPLSLALNTDQNGNYTVPNLNTGTYTISVQKQNNSKNGVDIFDLSALEDHIITRKLITDPYRLLAADVNNDQSIDIFDLSDMEDIIITRKANFNDNLSWRFIPTTENLTIEKVKAKSYTTTRTINATGDHLGLDFYGIKTGDIVDDNANPKDVVSLTEIEYQTLESRTLGSFSLKIPETKAKKNESIFLPIVLESFKDVRAFQFQVKWNVNALNLVGITDAIKQLTGFGQTSYLYDANVPGVLNVLWKNTDNQSLNNNTVLLRLNLKVLANTGDILNLQFLEVKANSLEGAIVSPAYTNGKVTVADISTKLDFSKMEYSKFDIYPNPGSHQIKVSYPKDFDLISIIDVYGKHYPILYKGQNNYTLDLARYTSGIYFIQSNIDGKPRIQKFMVHK